MRHLFFVEGFSEENFIESFLLFNNFEFTKDIGEFRTSYKEAYVENCRNDSTIKPSIKKNIWWIKELEPPESKVWIISDLNEDICFSSNKNDYINFFQENEILQELILVNSKPSLEHSYFDNPDHILKTVLSIHNTMFPSNQLQTIGDLDQTDLISVDQTNKFEALKTFCRANLKGHFNKKEFSEKFFFSIHRDNPDGFIDISRRLENHLSR